MTVGGVVAKWHRLSTQTSFYTQWHPCSKMSIVKNGFFKNNFVQIDVAKRSKKKVVLLLCWGVEVPIYLYKALFIELRTQCVFHWFILKVFPESWILLELDNLGKSNSNVPEILHTIYMRDWIGYCNIRFIKMHD